MNLPPFLLAAAVMFWGWQSGQWLIAGLVAVLLEAPRYVHFHFDFSLPDLNRLANLCTALLIGVAIYMVYTDGAAQAVIGTVRWIPLVVLPLMTAVAYSGMKKLDLSVISTSLRRRAKSGAEPDSPAMRQAEMGYPYVALWVLGASAANRQGMGFYLGLLVLGGWMLWRIRPPGRSPATWALIFLLSAAVGALLNTSLYRLQETIEVAAMGWMGGDGDEDSERTSTSLGHIGELKLSDSIVLRVKPVPPSNSSGVLPASASAPKLPLLLRTASYNAYAATSWLVAGDNSFVELPAGGGTGEWKLAGAGRNAPEAVFPMLEISGRSARPTSLIALPDGANVLFSREFSALARNRMASVQSAFTQPGAYRFRVSHDQANADFAAPDPQDLVLPRGDSKLLYDLVQQLNLAEKSGDEKLVTLNAWFSENFAYSMTRSGNAPGHTAMSDFLLRDRRGHCEHFASATALLLRAAGIPARYTVGYSVSEPARFGEGYVARHRHAHAWVRAYVNGAWRDFDTTPPNWPLVEQASAPFWEPLIDAWSWLQFHVQRQISRLEIFGYVLALAGLAWMGRKLARRKRKAGFLVQHKKNADAIPALHPAGNARELMGIEQILAERGFTRLRNEPMIEWLERISPQLGEEAAGSLHEILALYYRRRFGPEHAALELKESLHAAAQVWMRKFGTNRQG
ncbi:hypothetical protein BH11PSE11_BH11PSE11_18750 [soil metagenome]